MYSHNKVIHFGTSLESSVKDLLATLEFAVKGVLEIREM